MRLPDVYARNWSPRLKMNKAQIRFWTKAPTPTETTWISASCISVSLLGVFWWMDQLTLGMAAAFLVGVWVPATLFFVVRYVFRKKKETGGSSRRTADGPRPSGDRAD